VSFSLVTVGTGTVAPSATRSSPAHWVERGSVRLLMDCGAGTVHRLAQFGLAWERVSHVALTHFHMDHVGELPALLFALRWATQPPRVEPLVVLGPTGTVRLMDRLAAAHGTWVTEPGFPLVVLDMVSGEPFPLGDDVALEVHRTPHTAESVAVAVSAPEGRLVYTGDTGESAELATWAMSCELLLAECSLPDAMAIPEHLTPRRAGALAARAKARRLVLTHLYPPVEAVDVRSEVSAEYGGPVTIARDGDRFEVLRWR
jgi:ribonuclease BN (tRNA processing enzyme)